MSVGTIYLKLCSLKGTDVLEQGSWHRMGMEEQNMDEYARVC